LGIASFKNGVGISMNRFFVDRSQIEVNGIRITGKDVKHIKDVLRLKVKDMIEVVSEGILYTCQILDMANDMVYGKIIDVTYGKNEPPIEIVLFQGIAKGDKMDLIVQKSTEIGVKHIYPVVTKRTVVKIKDNKEKSKIDRWNAISQEAAKQSKRDFVPIVHDILTFNEMLDVLKYEDNIIVPYEMEHSLGLNEALKRVKGNRISIIIGPEGGFEEEEVRLLKEVGGQVVTLGPRILRTETAGIVTMSLILYELGDLGVIR